MFASRFQDRSVLLTGHTGFKGSWLTQWLLQLGANVHGYSFSPEPHMRLYDQLQLQSQLQADNRGDIRDLERLKSAIKQAAPDFVFHLAAQPLVRRSFDEPVETFSTNVMGTVNLLEAVRELEKDCTVVVVTTDKCYENREWLHSYRENDAMGGYDPYSASKGCAELVTASYRRSFFGGSMNKRIASARAGNVIGGGDWAVDRIVPDIFRAVFAKQPVLVRNKHATRPWQHVLEPLSGYLWLAACLDSDHQSDFSGKELCSGFNFGPELASNRTVADVVKAALSHEKGSWQDCSDPNAPHEASKLNLAVDKAFHMLHWSPTWNFDETIARTVQWYQADRDGQAAADVTLTQIDAFQTAAQNASIRWATAGSDAPKL